MAFLRLFWFLLRETKHIMDQVSFHVLTSNFAKPFFPTFSVTLQKINNSTIISIKIFDLIKHKKIIINLRLLTYQVYSRAKKYFFLSDNGMLCTVTVFS